MSMFHLGWFLGPGITIQGWNEPGFATGYDWTKPDIFVDAARAMERACFDGLFALFHHNFLQLHFVLSHGVKIVTGRSGAVTSCNSK